MGHHTGEDLGADLFRLLRASDLMDGMAEHYKGIAGKTGDIGGATDGAFTSDPAGGSRVQASWDGLCRHYHFVLSTTEDNLYDTSIALRKCINEYAAQDDAAAGELRRQIVDNNKKDDNPHFRVPKPGDRTPLDIPDDRDRDAAGDFDAVEPDGGSSDEFV